MRPTMRLLSSAAALTVASLPWAAGLADEAGPVVVSIKPIHSLVAGVMVGVGEPVLIVGGGASEHAYSLKPSDAAALEEAAVVFWVGEGLETYLTGMLDELAADAEVVALGEVEGLVRLEPREGGSWEAHGEGEAVHADHDHGTFDPHVWLDPVNAQAMVRAIVATLAAADPQHEADYRRNGAEAEARLDALTGEIAAMVAPVKDAPFIAFHDAYQYLEHRFGLNAAGAITVGPDVQPGAARLQEVRDRIVALGAVCVFSEPQLEPRLVATLTEGTPARTGVLDPMGAGLADGPDLYYALMRRNAQALRDCLGAGG